MQSSNNIERDLEVPEIHLFPEGSRKMQIERELRLFSSCAPYLRERKTAEKQTERIA